MARIRSVKPTFWTDEKVGLLPRDVRLTFLGLISAMADDYGRLSGVAKIVRGAVYPFDEDVTTADVESHLVTLASAGLITRYQVNGSQYIHIRSWQKHQRVDKPSPSLLPPPPEASEPEPRPITDHSSNDRRTFPTDGTGDGDGRELEKERERSGAEALASDLDPVVRDEDRSVPPVPLAVLPREAERFLERFYSLPSTTEKRRTDVRRQVYDVLDPRGRGARLRKGAHVKARSPEHLAHCCLAVMDDPPREIDNAIVFLLTKLQDPPPGPTPSEIVKVQEDKRAAEEEKYHAEMRRAGLTWAQANPAEYETIRLEVDARYANGVGGSFAKMARDSELAQKCAGRAGFITFDAWRIAS